MDWTQRTSSLPFNSKCRISTTSQVPFLAHQHSQWKVDCSFKGEVDLTLSYSYMVYKKLVSGVIDISQAESIQEKKVKCSKFPGECSLVTLADAENIEEGDYHISISFDEVSARSSLEENVPIENLELRLKSLSISKDYYVFQQWQRIVCGLVSFVALFAFGSRLRSVRLENRVWEQKMVLVAGFLLLFYNNPLWNAMFFTYKQEL